MRTGPLFVIAIAACAGAAFAQDAGTSSYDPTAQSFEYRQFIRVAQTHGAICHKDHSGLTLAPREPFASAQGRLSAAVARGGAAYSLAVEGLECAYCADAILKAIAARPEYAEAFYDEDAKMLYVVGAPGAAFDDARLEKIVAKRGYYAAEKAVGIGEGGMSTPAIFFAAAPNAPH